MRLILNAAVAQVLPQALDVQPGIRLNGLADVTTTNLQDGQFLVYNSSTQVFENESVSDIGTDITEIDGGTY